MTALPVTAGALRLWQTELRAGKRSPLDFDVLWLAACLEREAEEAQHDGLDDRAASCRLRAAALVLADAQQDGRAA